MHKAAWQTTLADAIVFARTLPGVTVPKVGFIGYSLGAYLGLRLRAHLKALVAFFPPWMDGIGPDSTPGLPVEIHFGDKDPLFVMGNMAEVEGALRSTGAAVTSHVYPGANHGFAGSDRDNTTARSLSHAAATAFLQQWI